MFCAIASLGSVLPRRDAPVLSVENDAPQLERRSRCRTGYSAACRHPLAMILLLCLGITAFGQEPGPELSAVSTEDLLTVFETSTSHPVRQRAVHELIRRRAESLPVLHEAAATGTDSQKLLALGLLCEMRYEGATELAIGALDHPSVKVRRRACTVLMRLKDRSSYLSLIRVLRRSQDTGVIKSAIAALGQIGDKRAISVIRPYLKHENDSVAVNTAIALASLGSEEGFDAVLSNLDSPDLQAQREATYGLGFFKNLRAKEAAQAIVESPDGRWKSEAHIALARIGMSGTSRAVRLSGLKSLLAHPNYQMRLWAIDELTNIGSQEAIAVLRRVSTTNTKEASYVSTKLAALGYE